MHSDREKLVERLHHAITTASNDDMSRPGTNMRERHTARLAAIEDAIAALSEPVKDEPVAEVKALREALLACRERAETGGLRIETAMDACEDISEIVACALPPEGWQAASAAVQGGDHGE